ncbi:Carbamoyl-phosphate synthase small subunit, N-terminal domain [Dillenia turbinata]|uniref:Carbamoyl-phosphate synthase small subunit, N-terminal domain n=1 Tax=Dillenia turbinata TaxID=194707 RepID=A0AAN8UML2_9MAGN
MSSILQNLRYYKSFGISFANFVFIKKYSLSFLYIDQVKSSLTEWLRYKEILTDPSYVGQFVLMTNPHIGNTGVNFGIDLISGVSCTSPYEWVDKIDFEWDFNSNERDTENFGASITSSRI